MKENKKFELNSRYNDVLTELEILSNDNRGIITTNGAFIRTLLSPTDDTVVEAIDYEGGPMVHVGDCLCGRKVKSIKHVQLIEFEE